MTTSSPTTNDLDWLAEQYVLGELSAEDAARFEAALADSPAACEAVVAASRLVLSLQTVGWAVPTTTTVTSPAKELVGTAHPTDRRSGRLGRQLVAIAAVAACCLVLVLAWSPVRPTTADRQVRAEVIQARELMDHWRGGRSFAGPLIASEEDDEAADLGDAAPSWMLAAVSIEKQKPAHPTDEDDVLEDN
ncbi:MAG: hypothetical protein SH850_18915 [Planctomycetaceae bacterium]|nr:hypothetical protein [Planctomycetaceae bacterium]